MHKEVVTVYDTLKAGCTLEPLVCLHCGSKYVIHLQYVGDAQCEWCGRWQLEE